MTSPGEPSSSARERIAMVAPPGHVERTLAAFQRLTYAQRENFVRNVVEAVLTYKTTGDSAVLAQFADDLLASAELRRVASYRRVMA